MSPKKALLADSSDSDSEPVEFRVNNEYAEKYDNWRKREEFQRLKDKYGENVLSEASGISESDSDSGQDSDPEEQDALLSREIFDDEFIRVYKALKQNDPIIYDDNVKFISNDPAPTPSSSSQKNTITTATAEKMNLMDYHLKLVTERQGKTEEDDATGRPDHGYYEELTDIKNELKAALSDDEDEELFKTIIRKKPESVTSPKLSLDLGEPQNETDRFLQQFILNKPYKQETSLATHSTASASAPLVEQDSELEQTQNHYLAPEARHRFEEAGGSEIRRYPRTLSSARDLVVREEKAAKRKETKDRKKLEKSEDMKRFTDLRRQEMSEKLSKLKQTSGNKRFLDAASNGFAFQSLIDDELFDPETHDQKMSQLFDNDYYDTNDDSKKPVFEFVEGLDDDFPDDNTEDQGDGSVDEANQIEDEDDEEDGGEDAGDSQKLSRKKKKQRKRRNKKVDLDRIPDYDDVVGGVPVRFKYCRVTPNDYGLSAEEILLADDKELNAWASLKKTVSFRDEQEEQADIQRYKAKRGDLRHKQKILKTLFDEPSDEPVVKKTKKRKRRAKSNALLVDEPESEMPASIEQDIETNEAAAKEESVPDDEVVEDQVKRKRQKRKRHPNRGVDEERLRAYGFTKSDMRRKKLL